MLVLEKILIITIILVILIPVFAKAALSETKEENLLTAIESNRVDKVREILESGIQINKVPDNRNFGYLTFATIMGHKEIVKLLISYGAEVNPVCSQNIVCKPVIYAAEQGNIEMLDLLIENGADVNSVGPYNFPVMYYPIKTKQYESIEVLLMNGADVNQRDQFKISIFEHAVSVSDLKTIKLMMNYGPDLNADKYSRKFTPLMMAAKKGRLDLVKYLIMNGADPDIKTTRGYTAKNYAEHNRHIEIANYLHPVSGN